MREMKESGIDWIGKIPKNWKIGKIKNFYKLQTGFTPDSKNQEFYDENGYNWITIGDLNKSKYIPRRSKSRISQKYIDEFKPLIIPKGSLLYSFKLSVGQVAIANQNVYSNEAIASFLANENVNLDFLYYSSYMIIENANENIYGAKLLNQELINNAYIIFPEIEEQRKISEFLDKKILQIDNVIEKTRKTIEDYKIYKQSIITKAVTKGLNENVEMKETGSEWIGKIPAHWNYISINSLFDYIDERNTDENAELLSLYTAIGVKPRSELEEKGNKAITVMNYKIVKENDIIVNKLLAWMGAIAYSDYNGVTSPDYDVYRAKKKSNVVKAYYNAYFRYTCFKGDCYKYGHGIMMMRWRTYPQEFLRIKVPNPPYEEQIKIAEYLDKKCNEIDLLIRNKEQIIGELEKYKKSLIYEYVTGKKEVI